MIPDYNICDCINCTAMRKHSPVQQIDYALKANLKLLEGAITHDFISDVWEDIDYLLDQRIDYQDTTSGVSAS